jgi:hypothetical protein
MYRTSLIFVIETTNKKQKTMKPQTKLLIALLFICYIVGKLQDQISF